MYITPNQYARVFTEIKRRLMLNSLCRLVLFVLALDIDAICTAKILSQVFRKELIPYQLVPVVGYTDLKAHYSGLDDEVTNVILLGCGLLLDLEVYLDIDPAQWEIEPDEEWKRDPWDADVVRDETKHSTKHYRRRIFIIDGHRPWNLENLFGLGMVVCFDDGLVDTTLQQEKEAYKLLYNDFTGDTDDESDTDDDEIEIAVEEPDSDDDDDTRAHKLQQMERQRLRQRRQRKNRLNDIITMYYNQGTTVLTLTLLVVYGLLTNIGETLVDQLWLAIIGTTALDAHYPQVYDQLQPIFKDEVARLGPTEESRERTADNMSLTVENDYHLFLLRHWTLYDAFFYLSQVNLKLHLWTEEGKKKLHKMFAKMGVLLSMAQQKWLYMDIRVKKRLPIIFKNYLPTYGLEGIVREGFIRLFGYTVQLLAMECVEAITALLESSVAPEEAPETLTDEAVLANIEKKEKSWLENYWRAWDALNMTPKAVLTKSALTGPKLRGYDLLVDGLERAKLVQQTVFRTGMSLLERKMVKNLRLYRLCVLSDNDIPDLALMNNPSMLAKLGTWLLDTLTEIDFALEKPSLKPLVVTLLDVAADTYLVMGLAPKYPRDMDALARARLLQGNTTATTRLNTFSVAFKTLAETSGAKVRIDLFDLAVIDIRRDDLSPFLEKLTLLGMI